MAAEIHGIHHVSLKCNSAELYAQTISFYRDILGLGIKRCWKDGIMFDTGAGLIEIFSTGTDQLPEGAVRHFAFAATDVDAIADRIREAGYPIIDGPRDVVLPSDPPCNARIMFCLGPVGEKIEFFDEK